MSERRRPDPHKEMIKQAIKDGVREGIKESVNAWLDQKYISIGRWTVRGITALVAGLLIHWYMTTHATEINALVTATMERWTQ